MVTLHTCQWPKGEIFWQSHKSGSTSGRPAPCPVPLNDRQPASRRGRTPHRDNYRRQKMEDKRRKCWDCRRRRLVCDLARPGCSKCQSAGRSCPGYGSNKPLKWMQPPEEINFRHAPRRQHELASSSGSTDGQESVFDSNAPSTTSTTDSPVPPLAGQDERPHDICQGSTEQAILMSDPCALQIQHELAEILESVEYCTYPPCSLTYPLCLVSPSVQGTRSSAQISSLPEKGVEPIPSSCPLA